jgi:hypothetical protein
MPALHGLGRVASISPLTGGALSCQRRNEVSDPCEKCGKPVEGYVPEYCCGGYMCGCMGRAITPCWCDDCWSGYDAQAKINAAAFASDTATEQKP